VVLFPELEKTETAVDGEGPGIGVGQLRVCGDP
jgi:hypothetical protein